MREETRMDRVSALESGCTRLSKHLASPIFLFHTTGIPFDIQM